LTCYSYSMARIMKKADIDVVLVGDSLGMVELGYENTIPVTVEEMVHHTRAVKRARPSGLLVTDMPFLSYNVTKQESLKAAGKIIKEGGAEAVKLEGGQAVAETVKFLVENNIPVMGHLGLTPQAVHKMGGYKVQGRGESQAARIVTDAKILEGAGAFAIVMEGVPSQLASEITAKINIPTIGIGAGPGCDGQILVVNDMLGMDKDFQPKFVKRYADLEEVILKAFKDYSENIRDGSFPSKIESY
ncbi:MAG: 3-methyl-2-oxobutanoate hydroxymethyltransferase, partial [Elusimicrobiota bacterium]|nr:3-methyl-2-oxobutanoate hydroxymethyltransferase [Elusimicrobiota bacterium]